MTQEDRDQVLSKFPHSRDERGHPLDWCFRCRLEKELAALAGEEQRIAQAVLNEHDFLSHSFTDVQFEGIHVSLCSKKNPCPRRLELEKKARGEA